MAEALVTPDVLAWARQRLKMSMQEVAARLHVNPEAIGAWESGDKRPTFRQARLFAQTLHVPLGYLYLSQPPIEELPIADFRTAPGQPAEHPSPDLLDLLRDVLGKQEWFREYRQSMEGEELDFVGKAASMDSEEEIAADIRKEIDVEGARKRSTDYEGFLRELTRNAEGMGIMVLRSGVVGNNNHRPLDVEEFRGFSVSDHIAPLIFINSRDFKGAQIFTFAHEAAHIWTGTGGLSNPDYSLRSEKAESRVEWFCNRIAAETLAPRKEFQSQWMSGSSSLTDRIKRLSSYFKVSQMVVMLQARDSGFLPIEAYWNAYDQWVKPVNRMEQKDEGGGNFHYTLVARNGAVFTAAVISSAAEGTLFSSEAADLLGVSVKTLPAIAKHLFGSPLNLG